MSPQVLAFAIASAVAVFAVSAARSVATRHKQLDRAHDRIGGPPWRAVPRVGGAGVVVAVALAAVVAGFAGALDAGRMCALLAPAVLVFGVGFVDDIRPVAAAGKLGAMLAAGALAWILGCRLESLPFVEVTLPTWASVLATSVWFAALGAAFDFVDGLDGLAAGLGAIAATVFGVVATARGDLVTATVAWSVTGAVLGFWFHNRHPATIFLGDGGALLIGALLAGISINVVERTSSTGDLLLIGGLAWPLLDLGSAVVRRAQRRALFRPDAEHLHHRLAARHGHAPAVARIHGISLCVAIVAVAPINMRFAAAAALLGTAIAVARTTAAALHRVPASGNAA